MPTFMESLASNPRSGGIYGDPGASQGPSVQDVLYLHDRIKDREMNDFKQKAQYMSDLSLRQNRLQALYGPESEQSREQPMNTVMRDESITPAQKAQLGIEQQKLGMEGQRIAQTGRLGEERIGIQTAQEKLNQQKSDQINAQKTAEHERKVQEEKDKVTASEAKLQQSGDNFNTRLDAMKEHQQAVESYHKAEMERKQHEFSVTNENHLRTIKNQEEQLRQKGRTKTRTTVNPEGTERTTTTERGTAADTVRVKGKDGQMYEIPADKVDEWNANHSPD